MMDNDLDGLLPDKSIVGGSALDALPCSKRVLDFFQAACDRTANKIANNISGISMPDSEDRKTENVVETGLGVIIGGISAPPSTLEFIGRWQSSLEGSRLDLMKMLLQDKRFIEMLIQESAAIEIANQGATINAGNINIDTNQTPTMLPGSWPGRK